MKILIIKLGAKGDVLRTLCILPALKEKFPDSEIYWLTKPENLSLFENNPYVTRVLSNLETSEKFDILYNFDIEKQATETAIKIQAVKKLGFYSSDNFPSAFNIGAEYYLNTLFDDELKKSNRKTYQQMMFDSAELNWKNQKCEIFLSEKEKNYGKDFLRNNNLQGKKIIGIHMGASSRWPSKTWHKSELLKFLKLARKDWEIVLFGGPNEVQEHENLAKELEKRNIKIYRNNPNNSDREFISLVNICDFMVCSDSFALHTSLSLGKKTACLFFCTSPYEVEGYGLLTQIVSPRLNDFFPEKCDVYNEELVSSIKAEEVLEAIKEKK